MRHIVLRGLPDVVLLTGVPENRRERRRGLLGRVALGQDEAMLFERTRSVHTVGMRLEIAAVLLNSDLEVREVVQLRRWRLLLPRRGTRHVLECAPNVRLRVGDRLRIDQAGQPPRPAAPVTTQEPASFSSARFTPSAASSESEDA